MRSVAQSPIQHSPVSGRTNTVRLLTRITDATAASVTGFAQAWRVITVPTVELARPVVGALGRAAGHQMSGFIRHIAEIIEPAADTIDITLTELTPADPTLALDIYAGIFQLGDRTMSSHGRSIFIRAMPSRAFAAELHGFTWLRHLAAADTPLARLNARALIEDWIELEESKRIPAITLEPAVVASRLKAWLTHAGWFLDGAPIGFRQRLLAQITRDFRLARRGRMTAGVPHIRTAAALLMASLAVPAFRRFLVPASRLLDGELKRQVLADGGHISRNPGAIVEILAEIMPLRDALAHAGMPASSAVMNAIDRMLPMLRFFLNAEGTLAHFNGATPVSDGLIDAVLGQVESQGRAHGNASHSGYQRLDASGTAVIMDCGTPPPMGFSGQAHAGVLAFEFSSATNRIVINCGTSPSAQSQWRTAARETAAHSTIIIDGLSSARPIETGIIAHMVGPTLFGGPREVRVDRREHSGATAVVASHDGYAANRNLIHERTIRLSASGDRIDGRDLLMPATDQPTANVAYVARFHLDPAIEPVLLANGVVMLMASNGEAWEFHAESGTPALEDSVYLADPAGPKPTWQIVLSGTLPETVEQRWTFVRTRGPASAKRG